MVAGIQTSRCVDPLSLSNFIHTEAHVITGTPDGRMFAARLETLHVRMTTHAGYLTWASARNPK